MLHLFSHLRMEKPDGASGASGGDPEVRCPACKASHRRDLLMNSLYVCPACGGYVRIPARDRIRLLADEGSFAELDETLTSVDFLSFPEYQNKLDKAKQSTGEKCAVVSGVMQVQGIPCAVFAMDSRFVMASMGSAVGEKITRLFEYATENGLPVLGVLCSGGARMQEGIVSLMQMAKCSGAVRKHSDAGLLYLSLLTDPTTGGMTASIAMEGDVTLAEPKTLIGFAGRRVIEQTTGAELPKDFQTSEFLLEHGFVDKILPREEQRETIALLLRQHQKELTPDG
ncbi:MAG: acetyl-CoA carboxylase carboxyl transferase subunit beta [Oscillospiraceae bacterium]|nr:acetyl-CoA carboxylase carboxyl transferase subunit beta [Oscillospiraceae bacterium]